MANTVQRGESRLELSFIVECVADSDQSEPLRNEVLVEVGVENYLRHSKINTQVGGCALTKSERDAVWLALPEWLQEKLMAEAIGNAEPCEEES